MSRAINFGAGPAAIPLQALERARDEMLDYAATGMSIMEQSHRGSAYLAVHRDARERLERLLQLPPTHAVLFLSGGATTHFAQVPMNFLKVGQTAEYVLTGGFSEKAQEAASFYGAARISHSTRDSDGVYRRVPNPTELPIDTTAVYVHTTSNNTLFGTQFREFPSTGNVPHVCDMSSDFLSRPIDAAKFAFVYAGAQKNIGPSGLVIAVASKEFLRSGRRDIPQIFRYQAILENDSLLNTPPTFAIYLARAVLRWLEEEGGVLAMEARSKAKARLVYDALDAAKDFYDAPVELESRSRMNVVFRCSNPVRDEEFLAQAAARRMVGLKGHRATGGIRASLYNAVSVADARALATFIKEFADRKG